MADWRACSQFLIAVFSLMLGLTSTGCNLYKSPDRDSFNSSAQAGAPRSQTILPKTWSCTGLTESDQATSSSAIERSEDGSGALVTLRDRIQICLFEFSFRPNETWSDQELIHSSRSLVP